MTGSRFAPVSWSPVLPALLFLATTIFRGRHWPVGHWRGFDKRFRGCFRKLRELSAPLLSISC